MIDVSSGGVPKSDCSLNRCEHLGVNGCLVPTRVSKEERVRFRGIRCARPEPGAYVRAEAAERMSRLMSDDTSILRLGHRHRKAFQVHGLEIRRDEKHVGSQVYE